LATIELRLDLRGNPHLGMHLGFCDPRRADELGGSRISATSFTPPIIMNQAESPAAKLPANAAIQFPYRVGH
jgi:hypothetical protein